MNGTVRTQTRQFVLGGWALKHWFRISHLHEAKQYRKLPRPRDARQVNQWLIQHRGKKDSLDIWKRRLNDFHLEAQFGEWLV